VHTNDFFLKISGAFFIQKCLENFSSNSSSISCRTDAITVFKTHTTRLNIIITKLLLHNIVCYENGSYDFNKFTVIEIQTSRNISKRSVETDDLLLSQSVELSKQNNCII
jgi:hypothetical protein